MPTSEPGITSRRSTPGRGRLHRGFSLLEILVVVAIIGVFVGITVLSTDLVGFQRKLEREANRLGTLIGFASDEAIMQTLDLGILICEDSYHFFLYDYELDEWIPYENSPFLARRFEPDIIATLRLDDLEVELQTEAEAFPPYLSREFTTETLADWPDPQIQILSTGEVTPFELEFVRESELEDIGVEDVIAVTLNVAFDGRSEIAASVL